MTDSRRGVKSRWWRGERGEWYVAVQFVLVLLLFLGPRSVAGVGRLPSRNLPGYLIGGALIVAGLAMAVYAAATLKRNMTPLPRPKENGELVQGGPYRWVRHPMYCGVILFSLGYGVAARSWLTIGYALVIVIFLDVKSRREERWLCEKYPRYRAYRERVRKLIPFIY